MWTRWTSRADAEQLRRLLAETARLERLQATLLGHISEGVLLQDATGRVLSSNPAARTLLGLSADRLHGLRALTTLAATDEDGTPLGSHERPTAATVSAGEGLTGRIIGLPAADGVARRWLSVTTEPVFAPSGEVEYVVSSMRDITEQHAAALPSARPVAPGNGGCNSFWPTAARPWSRSRSWTLLPGASSGSRPWLAFRT